MMTPSQSITLERAIEPRTHFIVATVGSAGDMFPFISVALAMQARGHPVFFLGPEPHRHYAEQAGLRFHALGSAEQYHAAVDNPALWHPRKGVAVVMGASKGSLHMLDDFIAALPGQGPCVMLAHQLVLPAAALARMRRPDMAVVGVYLAPSGLRTVYDPLMLGPLAIPRWVPPGVRRWLWRQIDTRLVDPHILTDLNQVRAGYGLAPVANYVPHMLAVPDLTLTLFPAWFGKTEPDWPQPIYRAPFQLYDPHPVAALPAALETFLARGPAPVIFTPGTGNRHAAGYFRHALAVSQQLGQRAIFLTPYQDQLPTELPDTILWQSYVPLRQLLPRAALLVHHGGIGTTAEALRAGVPQLVVALAFDQFDNGARVQALGVGQTMPVRWLSRRRLVARLRRLLASPTVLARCKTVAAQFEGDNGLPALCTTLESMTNKIA